MSQVSRDQALVTGYRTLQRARDDLGYTIPDDLHLLVVGAQIWGESQVVHFVFGSGVAALRRAVSVADMKDPETWTSRPVRWRGGNMQTAAQ